MKTTTRKTVWSASTAGSAAAAAAALEHGLEASTSLLLHLHILLLHDQRAMATYEYNLAGCEQASSTSTYYS